MTRNPFDEFNKIEKMFKKVIGEDNTFVSGTSHGISIQRIGDETKVEVHGDITDEEIQRIKKQYPDAEISINGKKIKGSSPVEVVDKETKTAEEREKVDKNKDPVIEEIDEEEMSSEELALKRLEEKKEKEE